MNRLLVRVGLWLARRGGWTPAWGSALPGPEVPPGSWEALAAEYAAVFGPVFRDVAYRALRHDLEYHGFLSRSTTEDAVDAQGRVDPFRVGAHEGRRTWLLRIKSILDAHERGGT